jgi:lipopolysaccharide/colanic/teichoic acid biosynthesis glycosyltransferase
MMNGQQALDGVELDTCEIRPLDYDRLKRCLDLALTSLLLVALLPILAAIAAAIMLDSPGPVLYVHDRAGFRGRVFRMFKFRTMRPDRRVRQVPISFPDRRQAWKIRDDPRITRVGRVLRRTSLDELPQLLNILRGDMSLVGPRPELPELVARYGALHHLRHLGMPGVTGWWQVHGRCTRPDGCGLEEDLAVKLADDMYYLQHRSLRLDLRILFLTIPVIVRGHGAT